MGDGEGLGGVHLRGTLHVLGLVGDDGGQVSQLACGGLHQLPDAHVGGGGHFKEPQALGLHVGLELFQQFPVLQDVGLVGHHQHLAAGQVGAVLLELGADGVEVLHGVAALAAGHVHHMDEQTAAVDVTQEVVAQTGALSGTLDDAGDVGHDEGDAVVHEDHAQVGEEGGEVVVGDLGAGLGGHGQQGGLAHVGEANQTHVSQELQFQQDVPLLAGQTCLGELGGLTGGGGKALVAPAAVAAPAQDKGLVVGHIPDDLLSLGVTNDGTTGDLDDEGCAVLAGAVLACAVAAVFGHVLALVAEVHQGGHAGVGLDDDVAAPAAVAAVGTAVGDILFPVEGHCAVAAGTGTDQDAGGINKLVSHMVPLDLWVEK